MEHRFLRVIIVLLSVTIFFDNGGHCNQRIQAGESMTAESSSKEKPSYSGYGYHGGAENPPV